LTRSCPAGKEVFLGQIPLILPDIHVVEFGSVAGSLLDLLGYFPAGKEVEYHYIPKKGSLLNMAEIELSDSQSNVRIAELQI
jgi:hypothetical protein